MTRALIDFKQDSLNRLDRIAAEAHTSRSALIREAVDFWLDTQEKPNNINAFGILKNQKNTIDGLVFQEKARKEWE